MTIDTKIRHVTKPGANVFLELGFSADEAKRLYAASQKQINDTRLLKEQLMTELSTWIEQHQLKQRRDDQCGAIPAIPEHRQGFLYDKCSNSIEHDVHRSAFGVRSAEFRILNSVLLTSVFLSTDQ